MEIKILATKSTPLIELDTTIQTQRIEGISIPIDAYDFYKPATDFLVDNASNFLPNTNFHFKLNYYNTSSNKALFIILQKILLIKKQKEQIKIIWEFDDENEFMLESGQEFADLLNCEFHFVNCELK